MEVAKLLTTSPLFSNLSLTAIYRLAELAQIKIFHPGEIIIKEGHAGLGCFIIVSGKVEVVQAIDTSTPQVITQLGINEIIGELSVIDDQPYSFSVRAIEETQCIMIEQWDFKAQMQAYPEIALQLLPVLARRLRALNEKKYVREV